LSALLLCLCSLALAASGALAASAWHRWRQRRLATVRAQGPWQAGPRLSGIPALRAGLSELFEAWAQSLEAWLPAAPVQSWNARLRRFPGLGRHSGDLALRCLGLGLLGCLLLAFLGLGPLCLFGLGLGVLPALRLRDAEQRRRQELRQSLPDAVDLLTACVQAGLGIDLALQRAGEQLAQGPLREEWLRTLDQLRTGAERRLAFQDWQERCESEDLGAVLRAILRSEQRGVPLSPVLQAASEQMRRLRSLRIQEQASKAPIKLLVPLMLFFMPAVFLILFGPIFLKLSELGF
jgi:Flp pilus assembly protein TadB